MDPKHSRKMPRDQAKGIEHERAIATTTNVCGCLAQYSRIKNQFGIYFGNVRKENAKLGSVDAINKRR